MPVLRVNTGEAEAAGVSSLSVENIKQQRKSIDAAEDSSSIQASNKKLNAASRWFATSTILLQQ
jgi:hypothetical protein